jgi:hypothetical protein
VVRTLTSLAKRRALDAEISFLTPDGFPVLAVSDLSGLRVALPNRREIARRIEEAAPDALHIATEGPIGWAVRALLPPQARAFTTSYTTRFPEYVAVRTRIPASVGYALLRHFHAAAVDHHGRDSFIAAGAERARLSQARFLDPRRRHRSVLA